MGLKRVPMLMIATSLRRVLLPPLDTVKSRLFGGFAISHSTEDEYAATVYCTEDELAQVLDALSFSSSLFSALKIRLDGNREDSAWVRREHLLADEQLHVVTHRREDGEGIDVYAHLEASKLVHPIDHYRKVGYDADAGIERFRTLFKTYCAQARNPPQYEVQPPHHRSWSWALHLVSFISTPAAARLGRRLDRLESRLDPRD